MMQLFIEGQEADIDQQFSTLLTASINDIKSFGTKESTFSKTIILPGTKKNNILFGNIFNTTTRTAYNPLVSNFGYNFNAAVSAKVLLMNQSIQQMKGTIRLLQINVDGAFIDYEVSIVGELGGFCSKLGAAKIDELDFSAYNHLYNLANIRTSWDNATGAGYFYPVADYGNYGCDASNVLGGKHSWRYKTLRPALFVKQYIDKIFDAAGFTYDCALFNTARFKTLVIPHNQKVLSTLSTLQLKLAGNVATYTGALFWRWNGITLGSFTGDSNGEYWTYNGTPPITVNINVLLTGQVISQTGAGTFLFELVKNGTVVLGSVPVTTTAVPPSFTFSSKTIAVTNITLVHGDSLIVRYPVGTITSLRQIIGTFQINTVAPSLVPSNLNDTITINDAIPKNVLQKDFFASILKLFNLYVYEDSNLERHMIIKPFIDFHNGDAEDWSDLVDRSKVINIKPMSELTARYYEFKYKEDTDYYNDAYKKKYNVSYGSYLFDTEFEFAQDKNTADVIFSGTPLVGYTSPTEDKVYSTILKQTGTTTIVEETIDSNIRIWQTKKITGVASWNVLDSSTNLGSQTYYGFAGHFDHPTAPTSDLNFGMPGELYFVASSTGAYNVNQFNLYYSSYMAEITDKDSKMMSCTIRLTKKDWNELSFAKYKWIDGSLWRLNKITDYNATSEDSCKAEFIKLIEKEY